MKARDMLTLHVKRKKKKMNIIVVLEFIINENDRKLAE